MLRVLTLSLVLGPLAWSQSVAIQKAFLHDVDSLLSRPINALDRLQVELGLSATSAEAVLATVRAYKSEADRVESVMRRSILTRRLQVAGEFRVTYSSELDVVNWANLDLNLFMLEQMDELHSRLGEEESQKLLRFFENHSSSADSSFPLRSSGGWQQSPLTFWRDSVKGPLTDPESESLFIQTYKDAALPPPDMVPYFEGTVVSVTPEDSQGRKVLLSMQGDGPPDAALRIDGVHWKLSSEPEKGAIVRFSGAAIEFTQEPFLVLFAPERIAGLSLITDQPNAPFTTPGLAR